MREELERNLKIKNYKECIKILERNINTYFSNKVKKELHDYEYTTLNELAEISDKVFDEYTNNIFREYYNLINSDEEDDSIYLDCLMEMALLCI